MKEDHVDEAVRVLNEALEADPKAVRRLLESSVPVNSKLARHPKIRVTSHHESGMRLRALGLINGIMATNGSGQIAVLRERRLDGTKGEILRFEKHEAN